MQAIPGADREQQGPATARAKRISQPRWAKNLIGLIANRPDYAVYGAIAVGVLLAAETARRETYPKTVVAVVITLMLYWLAHSYADLAGERLRSGARLTPGRFLSTLLHDVPLLIGAAIPLATLLICWAVGTKLPDAVIAAVWTSAAIIVTTELGAGLRGRLGPRHLLIQAFLGALLGSLVIVLRALLH
jgi:hypothetical protein